MKVYIGPYAHWFQPASWLEDWVLWWYGFSDKQHWHVIQRLKHGNAIDEMDNVKKRLRKCRLYKVLNCMERWVADNTSRKVRIRIDHYDVWNLGDTLAMIALPMLYEFKKQGIHGAPHVDDEDVPEHLRSTSAPPLTDLEKQTGGTDKLWHQRWEWVVQEMIYALEEVNDPDSDSRFHSDIDPEKPRDEAGISFQESMDRGKFDKDGYDNWHERKQNGLRLFGKYLEALWN